MDFLTSIDTWMYFTLLAAFMQAVRTAAQKYLSTNLSPMATTTTRYLFGLPFALLYLYWLISQPGDQTFNIKDIPNQFTLSFWFFVITGGIAQILATAALIKTFQYENFAVGTCFAKTEALQTAFLGGILFANSLTFFGWLGIVIGVFGTLVMSYNGFSLRSIWHNPSLKFGLLSGLGFAFTSLFLREASISLSIHPHLSAGVTLVCMVTLQTLICVTWLYIQEREQIIKLVTNYRSGLFIGATSALGSVGWFTAMTLENPALVKTLGQVEFFATIAITYFFFGEKITKKQYAGMLLILLSVITVTLLY